MDPGSMVEDSEVGQDAPDLAAAAHAMCDARGARLYQREVTAECLQHMQASRATGIVASNGRQSRSALIQSPTGSGKTLMGLVCAAVMQNELGLRVGWCAGRRELLLQAKRENQKFGLGVELTLISMFDRDPPQVDLLVVDEAHHDGAMSMATLHGRIAPKYVIGLTATPFRRDRVKLCFEKVIRSCSIQRLVDDGYLSRYRQFTVPSWAPVEVAAMYARERARWGKSLVFFRTRLEAEKCLRELERLGVRAELVTGTSDRERQIAEFEQARVDVLLSMNVLTEGFDCPSLRTVFCRPASRAPTVQMCGRVFRLHDSAPLKQIVQARDAAMPFTRIVRPEEQHLLIEGEWRSLGATRELDAEVEAQRIKLAQVKVAPLPALILRKQRSRSGQRRGSRANRSA
jgi:superfamily II DNA or RNA helicase